MDFEDEGTPVAARKLRLVEKKMMELFSLTYWKHRRQSRLGVR